MESILIDLYYRNLFNRHFKSYFESNCHFFFILKNNSSGNVSFILNVWQNGHLLTSYDSNMRLPSILDWNNDEYLGILYYEDVYYTVRTQNSSLEFSIL